MNFLTTTLPLRAYLFTFAVFVTAIIFVQNGFSVGNYSLNALSSHAFSLHKTYSVWGSESETYMSISPPLPLIFMWRLFREQRKWLNAEKTFLVVQLRARPWILSKLDN